MSSTRRYDFLDLHDNVARRIRNLETGVHALRCITDFYESIPPTLFPKDSPGGSAALSTDTSDSTPYLRAHYQKRAGIGALIGYVRMDTPHHSDLQDSDGGLWGTLPDTMRPTLTHTFLAWASETPHIAQVAVHASGQVRLAGGSLPNEQVYVYLDGLTWPVA